MARVRANIQRLVPRLEALGYEFEAPDEVYVPPGPDAPARVAELETLAGPLPLSLRAWYEVVGSVNLVGVHLQGRGPLGPSSDRYPDPLVVYPIEAAFDEYEQWLEMREHYGAEEIGTFRVPIAPDDYHKADVSGGMWYHITLPNAGMDAVLEAEWHHVRFVEYLRESFRWGGFPGFARYADRPERVLAGLAEGMMRF